VFPFLRLVCAIRFPLFIVDLGPFIYHYLFSTLVYLLCRIHKHTDDKKTTLTAIIKSMSAYESRNDYYLFTTKKHKEFLHKRTQLFDSFWVEFFATNLLPIINAKKNESS